MDIEKKFDFFWRGEYKSRNIYTKKFATELESELSFFSDNGITELVSALNNFKNRKNQYETSNNSSYLQYLKQTINVVSWIYSESESITKYNTICNAITDGIITTNSALRKRLLPLNQSDKATALVDDVHIGFYYNFKLKEYIEPEMLSNYKEEIDKSLILNQKNNQDLKDSHELFTEKIKTNIQESSEFIKDNIDFSTSVLDKVCESYVNVMLNLEDQYKRNMLNLEDQYQRKLQFDKPSEFWNTKSTDYKITSNKWLIASGLVTLILLIVTVFISTMIFDITWDTNLITIEMIGFSKDLTFGNILLITAIESIIIYILKTCIKYYDYNLKLYEFYKSKAMLSSFYVTIKDDDLSEPIKEKIYTQLFASSNIDFDKVEDTVLSKLK